MTTNANTVPFENNDESLHDTPQFHRHAEATTAELFYDLFFVANLTTFTSLLDINDHQSLSAYIGFFCILWFTWYQVSLYDVRFASDSIFERMCKACHFGVMIGLAVVAPDWKPGKAISDYSTYKALTLILMASRFVLVVQYGSTLWFTWRYRRTRLPLIFVMGSYTIAGILYGALTAAFPKGPEKNTTNVYIAWYVIAILETALTTAVSCKWRIISFKGTHMQQRMSLLTLIILGEGIIVIAKSISKIVKNYYTFTSPVIGNIVSAILIIYFLYMLYFDRMLEDHFGTIKQQIWAFAHFPLHIALVLVLEGTSNFITWRQAVQGINAAIDNLQTDILDYKNGNFTTAAEFIHALNDTAWNNAFYYVPKGIDVSSSLTEVNNAFAVISNVWNETASGSAQNNTASDEFTQSLEDIVFALANTILESLSIEAPEPKVKDGAALPTPAEQTQSLFNVFNLVFIYFFVAAGITLIVMGFLAMLSDPPKKRGDYFRGVPYFVVGIGICLLSLMNFTDAISNYAPSPWVLPTLCLSLFFVVVANHMKKKKKEH
ncbi:hypothetical protein K432DRAFT_434855 [Lepidopterella palustris CBS 459.81]|uniref:Low temperature requirement A n=1 Tax=Lepidopterella palustris CBS 459.81 TaxID=1314670 RepID=A0A8E2EAE5_9PEZI|nr:hypothetical protein K432DRAFT_434855 [Lepidopterella palustris CBS 459.81]